MYRFFSILMSTFFVVLIFVSDVSAQVSRRNDKVVTLSPDAAAECWAQFAQSKIAADYCMTFTLTHIPRREKEIVYVGEIFGANIGKNSFTRIRVSRSDSDQLPSDFIMLDSPDGCRVWKSNGLKFEELPADKWNVPMCEGLIYSPFDILAPFKKWESRYDGAGRIGQAVHFFNLVANGKEKISDISKVRVALTREFNTPAQIETFGVDGELSKTMTLGSVRKVDGLWIMLEASVRNEKNRDKDKLRFRAVKLRAQLDAKIFDASLPVSSPEKPLLESL